MNKKIKCIDLVSYAIIKPKYGGLLLFYFSVYNIMCLLSIYRKDFRMERT